MPRSSGARRGVGLAAWRALWPALLFAPLLAACAVSGPVDIDTSADACARCRMSIDTLAHAGEIITGDGAIRKYDSLGCLLEDYREAGTSGRRPAGTWVIDYTTKRWVKAEAAHYALANLSSDHMGFGVAASATREGALTIAHGDGSKVVDWQGLLAYRK